MSIIVCDNISLSYGVKDVLKNITFAINQGAKIGIIGANGAGKTSLLRIITGEEKPTEGQVYISKDISIGFLEQVTDKNQFDKSVYDTALEAFKHLISLEEEIEDLRKQLNTGDEKVILDYTRASERFLSEGGYEYKAKTKSFLKNFGFGEEMLALKASLLSGGQKTKLKLVVLLLQEPDIIMLDEPTNHLDIETVNWLEDFILSSNKTFIIISHDRYFLDKTTTDTLEIENTNCIFYSGSYSNFKEKKEKLLKDRQKHYSLQQKEIKRIEDFIENQRRWNRERNIIAAESRMKALERMDKLEKPKAAPKTISFNITPTTSKSFNVLSVRNLTKNYPCKKLINNLSFELHYSDRLFILGRNGSGKSTLLKILTNREKQDSGVIELGYNQKIGYYDQDQQQLDFGSTVIEELWSVYSEKNVSEIRGLLARFGFFGDDVFKKVSVLSGGELARLSIAKMILNGVSLLILDEPTNHLDIPSKEMLELALKEYEGTIICVSHDRYFISALATKIMHTDDMFHIFKGGYESFIKSNITQKIDKKEHEKRNNNSKSEYKSAKKEKNRKRFIEQRIPELEIEISEKEKRLEEITNIKMNEAATDYERLTELYEEETRIQAKISDLYDELLALEEESENKSE